MVYYNVFGDYNVQNKKVEDGAATTTLITGLVKGTKYEVRVVSYNEVGSSDPSGIRKECTDIDRELLVV